MTHGRHVLFSDIDHTFYRGSLGMDAIEWLLQRRELSAEFAVQWSDMKARWQTCAEPYEAFVRLVSDFLDRDGMAGVTEALFRKAIDEIVAERGQHVFVFTRELIASAQECGYATAAISQSPEYAVDAFAKEWKFDHAHGTRYFVDDEHRLTGKRLWFKKDQAVKTLYEERQWRREDSVAIGDSLSDAPMFQAVDYPIAINPSPGLEQLARGLAIPVVKECNNTIVILCQAFEASRYAEAWLEEIVPMAIAKNLRSRLNACGYEVP